MQSPNLNLIENLWHKVKNSVRRCGMKPSNLAELDHLVLQAWQNVSRQLCQRLIDSMSRRVKACITANVAVRNSKKNFFHFETTSKLFRN